MFIKADLPFLKAGIDFKFCLPIFTVPLQTRMQMKISTIFFVIGGLIAWLVMTIISLFSSNLTHSDFPKTESQQTPIKTEKVEQAVDKAPTKKAVPQPF